MNDAYQLHKRLRPTTPDDPGPFYLAGAPVRTLLCEVPAIRLVGFVLDTQGGPVAGATLDFWHAGPEGAYTTAAEDDYRGVQTAGEQGEYLVLTDHPGGYEIGEGEHRAAHFHVKVTAAGFRPLTTALYFHDDVRNLADAWYDSTRLMHALAARGVFRFDFVLSKDDTPAPKVLPAAVEAVQSHFEARAEPEAKGHPRATSAGRAGKPRPKLQGGL